MGDEPTHLNTSPSITMNTQAKNNPGTHAPAINLNSHIKEIKALAVKLDEIIAMHGKDVRNIIDSNLPAELKGKYDYTNAFTLPVEYIPGIAKDSMKYWNSNGRGGVGGVNGHCLIENLNNVLAEYTERAFNLYLESIELSPNFVQGKLHIKHYNNFVRIYGL